MQELLLYKTTFYMVAAMISVVAFAFLSIDGFTDRRQTKVLLLMLADVFTSSVGGIVYKLSQPYAPGNNVICTVMLTFQFLDFLAHTALAPLFFLYVNLSTGAIYRQSKRSKILFALPFLIEAFMVILNPFLGWVYYFDRNYNFYRNWGETITYIVAVFYFLVAMSNMFFYWYAINQRRRRALLYSFIIVIAGVVIQLVSITFTVELVGEAMGCVIILLAVEREDDRIDQPTRTYNRMAFQSDLNNFYRLGRRFHIVFIRILNHDILKRITGSSDNDRLFNEVALYLRQIHSKYHIYRTQPNSFVLVCHDNTDEEVQELSNAIQERFKKGFNFDGSELLLKIMLLWASAPEELKDEESVMQLIDGEVTNPEDEKIICGNEIQGFLNAVSLEKALYTGLSERNYEVYYQPIYNTKDKSIYGAEAQICLNDSNLGVVDWEEIMPIAVKYGIDISIGKMLLEEVCMFLGSGIPTELGLTQISVGVSVRQCMCPDFVSNLKRLCDKYNVNPTSLNIEMQEPREADQFDRLVDVTRQLKDMGFVISLDGFGKGYTNMHLVTAFGASVINLDATGLGEEVGELGKAILRYTIRMLKEIDYMILIKGADTKEQLDWVVQMDVDFVQSDYYSKVVTQNELISILRVTEIARRDEQRARAGSEAKSNFLANMSHEIRTPINAILGMNEMILRESKNDSVLGYAKDIENASKSLLALINDILDFSKIEAGNMEIVEGEYFLSSLLNDVISMIQLRAEKKDLGFDINVSEELPDKLYGDEMRIRQVLINILNNAVKYTDKGTVGFTAHGVISSDHTVKLVFDISDTGRGIKEEDKDKLFETFQRLDMVRNRTVEGTGLGLAITNNLVNLMDGEIKVESEYGKGSVFTVSIPQQIIDDKPIGNLKERYERDLENRPEYHESFVAPEAKILVVDDTPINLTVIQGLLKQTKIQIDLAKSGMECLELVAVNPYDVIFLDYRMPEMDGVTTLKIMKEMQDYPNMETPIVLLTANALTGAREKFLEQGFDDYMTKPIDSRKLEEILIEYLPKDKVILQANDENIDEGESSEIIKRLEEEAGLDTKKGLANCGSPEGYLEVVTIYRNSVDAKVDEIGRYYDEKDYANFTIQVHSLKSTSRIIGALDISERAWELEQAGDRKDENYISKNTEDLLFDYLELGKRLKEILPMEEAQEDDSELDDISDDMLNDGIATLKEFAENMSYDDLIFVLDELSSYKLSSKDKQLLKDIRNHVEQLDWEGVLSCIEKRGGE